MKIYKHTLLFFFITLVLFIIPFFWLRPGEMDLGGDSSRLYFYDPLSYLFSSVLYSVSASSFGLETIYYHNFPFISLLMFLRLIFTSPTLLISIFHGLSLSIGFAFTYLTIKELIGREKIVVGPNIGQYAAILGGISYVLSPALIDGWEHVLLSHNQVFLNPLIFWLLLKYFKTSNINYIFITVVLTFIFSPSFSIISAPAIFAFYPISLLFLILYTKLIIKKKILLKHLLFGFFLFLGVQAFHLIPQMNVILAPGNEINATIFSNESKFNRGLSYFSAIAPSIKASINLLGFPQMRELNFFAWTFIAFPLIITFSLIFNKKKTLLLTAIFFLVILFFSTANITNVWLSSYKALFNVPGFSMFRNFYGQWQFVYVFFYSILFAQALYIVSGKLSKKYAYVLLLFLILILLINAKPFITGELVRRPLWQSNNVLEVMKMDPDYEQALNFIRFLPADAKILTLPMSDPGYQIIAGVDGGAYMGPSTIAYLAGKKDFAGTEEFSAYKDLILNFIKDKKYEDLRRIFGMLNIKYIFYNADTKAYGNFPGFPYLESRNFLPKDQSSYEDFIQDMKFKQIKNINDKFFVYELQDDNYLPQIYVASKALHYNKPFTEINIPLSINNGADSRIVVDNNSGIIHENYPIKFNEVLIDIRNKNSLLDFFINADASIGFPYAFSAWKTDSLVYPFVVWRENLQSSNQKVIDDNYIEMQILLADKRISEIERWGKDVSILGKVNSIDSLDRSWKEPSLLNALVTRDKYNFWEVSFLRYQRTIQGLMEKLQKPNDSKYSSLANKEKIKKAVIKDRERFYTIIERSEKLSKDNKIYLLRLSVDMFDRLLDNLQVDKPSPAKVVYSLNDLQNGEYEVFIDKKAFENTDNSKLQISINDKNLYLKDFEQDKNWYKGQKIIIKNPKDRSLTLLSAQSENLISNSPWIISEKNNLGENYASFSIENYNLPNNNGLVRKINDWSPSSYYLLSFEYLTHGKSFKIATYDKSLQKDSFRRVLEDELRSSEWKSYETIFLSSKEAYSAFIQISKSDRTFVDMLDTDDINSKFEIKNFSIVRIPNPKIILKKVIKSNVQPEVYPKIIFTRINPAKYKIDIKNAVTPYILVFNEAFNYNWRLVNLDTKIKTDSVRGNLPYLFGQIGSRMGIFVNIERPLGDNKTINYFNGDVKENHMSDIFLDSDTFNAWGRDEFAYGRHFAANGYSNAWYIEPKDANGKNSYTLILEMTTQKMFYPSLAISIFTLALLTILIIKNLFNNK